MKLARLLCALLCLLGSGTASAVISATDNVPAATLLLPYFEVLTTANLEDQMPVSVLGPENTVAQVRNHSNQPQLVHVTLWTDYGIPTLAFDIYLNGNDSQTIDLRLLFAGVLPVTGTGISRPNNVSGVNPPPPPNCATRLNTARLSASQILDLRNAHRGLASAQFSNQCAGRNYGDERARGYLTVDVVNSCSAANVYPSSAGYFVNGGNGIAGNQNVLSGEYTVTDSANNRSWSDRLVAIEASASHPDTSGANRYTFYGGFFGFDTRDNREALATNWAARYVNGGAFDESTDLLVWRDPRGSVSPVACSSVPVPWNLPVREIALFDEQTNAAQLDPTRTTMGLAAQRLRLSTNTAPPASGQPWRTLYSPYSFGTTLMNLNDSSLQPNAHAGSLVRQSWVVSSSQAAGRFQVGASTTARDQVASANTNGVTAGLVQVLPLLTTTSIVSDSPDPSPVNTAFSIGIAVTPPGLTGQVRVSMGNANCTITLPTISCLLTPTMPGQFNLSAAYLGNSTHAPSTSALEPHTVSVSASPATAAKGGER